MADEWDYHLISFANERDMMSVQDALQTLGGDGWELVAVYPHATAGHHVFILKKRKS